MKDEETHSTHRAWKPVHHHPSVRRDGVCDFEISNNARMGTAPIGTAISATLADGLSKRP